jgi:hypothetical protein
MADLGPLSAAAAGGADVPPEMVPNKTQTDNVFQTILETSRQKALAGQKALDSRREQLLQLSQKRMFDPVMMRFAGGMFAPTKTGGFGESLGYAANAAADEQEKEFARQQAIAKLQYEMDMESIKQQEDLTGNQIIAGIFNRKSSQQPMAAKASPIALPSVNGAPSVKKSVPEDQLTPDIINSMSNDEIFALSLSKNPTVKETANVIMKIREQERKENVSLDFEGQKREIPKSEYERYQKLAENNDWDGLRKWHVKYGVPFNYIEDANSPGGLRPMTAAEKAEASEKGKSKFSKQEPVWVYELGRNLPMNPNKADEYDKARTSGKGKEWLQKNFPEAMPSGTSGQSSSGSNLPPEKAEEAGKVSSAQERAKGVEDVRRAFMNRGMNAQELVIPANEILMLAQDPVYNQAMALIDGPGLKNAVAKAISQGVKVGDWNVGFPALRDTIMQLKTGPDGKPLSNEIRQAIIDGSQKYLQNATTIELLFTQNYMNKQGAITEGERALVRQTGFNKEDSPNVVKAKAKMLIAKGEYDRKAAEAFIDWEKKNPGGTVEEFELKSPERRALFEERDRATKAAYAEHFPSRTSSGQRRSSADRSSSTTPDRNTTPGVNQDAINRFAPR